MSEREGGEFRSPRPNLTAAPFFAVQANLFEKHCGQVGSIFAQFAQFLLAPRDFALWEMPSTDVFRCLVLSIRSYFGLCFSPGFTHGSLSPFDASILQEFTPIGRGFVTLRGGFWTLQKKEERESIQQDPVDWQSIDFLLTLFHAFFFIYCVLRGFFFWHNIQYFVCDWVLPS